MTLKNLATAMLLSAVLVSCGDNSSTSDHSMLVFLGGSGNDIVSGIATGPDGSFYVTGKSSSSWGSPLRAYASGDDVFVAKITSSGEIEWLTFLGGSGNDSSAGICLDSSGNVYVAGTSSAAWGEPVRAYASGNDCFVARLGSTGALSWNTFIGGSGIDTAGGICASGTSVFISGSSSAAWGVPVNPFASGSDIFCAMINSSGNVSWSTFAGGTGDDYGKCIATDGTSLYVGGYSSASWGSPVRGFGSGSDAVVVKLTQSDGIRSLHTFLGGNGSEYGLGIAAGTEGRIYLTGYGTGSWGNPVRTYSGADDGFAACINTSLALSWNTFLGGEGDDNGCAVYSSDSGICVAGASDGTWGEPYSGYTGGSDVHVTCLSVDGMITRIGFYGSIANDSAGGITAGSGDRLYLSGWSSAAWGNPFIQYSSGQDGFVAELE